MALLWLHVGFLRSWCNDGLPVVARQRKRHLIVAPGLGQGVYWCGCFRFMCHLDTSKNSSAPGNPQNPFWGGVFYCYVHSCVSVQHVIHRL